MNHVLKKLVIGTIPAALGAGASVCLGERLGWPQADASQPTFQATTLAASQPAVGRPDGIPVFILPADGVFVVNGRRL